MVRYFRWLIAALLVAQAAAPAARRYSVEDLLAHEDIGPVLIDPGGRWLIFEKYEPRLAMQRQDRLSLGRILRARPYIAALHGQGPAMPLFKDDMPGTIILGYSPSGKRLAVARWQAGTFRLGIVTLSSRAVHWWDYAPVYDGFRAAHGWLSDDRLVLLTQRDGRPAARLGLDWPPEQALRDRWDRTAAGDLAVSVSGSGRYLRSEGRSRQQLLLVDVVTQETRSFAEGPFSQMQLSPDRRHVALIEAGQARQPTADMPVHEDDAYFARKLRLLDLASGRQWHACVHCDLPGDPRWSDDGSKIAFVADREGHRQAMVVDMHTGLIRTAGTLTRRIGAPYCLLAAHQNVPAAARASVGLPEVATRFAVAMSCDGDLSVPSAVWKEAPWSASPDAIKVEHKSRDIVLPWRSRAKPLSVETAQVSATGDLLLRVAEPSGRTMVLLVRSGSVRPMMILNDHMGAVEPGVMQPLAHHAADGTPVTSWLVLPPGGIQAALPLVVSPYPGRIYGKVAPADQQLGSERFHSSAQLLAAQGFAVLLPSLPMPPILPDGGYDFAHALAPAIEAATATGRCDPARIALWGHSYGGYSVAMAAAQSDRFRAIVASAGIYDLAAIAGTFGRHMRLAPEEGLQVAAAYGWAEIGQGRMGQPPWLASDRYVANNPIYQADRIKAPMLILGADRDFSPIEQGEQLFSALFRQGKDAQLVTYWGEGHVIGSPENLRDFYRRVIGFLKDNLSLRADDRATPALAARAIRASTARQ